MNLTQANTDEASALGYTKIAQAFSKTDIDKIKSVCLKHHEAWKKDNLEFYQSSAINSAYLTAPDYLTDEERLTLFRYIANSDMVELAKNILQTDVRFMGTQLFFNPYNANQPNYWHRDPQYHLDEQAQQDILKGSQRVWHFRIALEDEPGIELVPGSHLKWDSEEERQVRLQLDGHKNHEALSTGQAIPLKAGDMLAFSAMAIHRGLYGGNRLALDILYCSPDPELTEHIRTDCFPSHRQRSFLDKPDIF